MAPTNDIHWLMYLVQHIQHFYKPHCNLMFVVCSYKHISLSVQLVIGLVGLYWWWLQSFCPLKCRWFHLGSSGGRRGWVRQGPLSQSARSKWNWQRLSHWKSSKPTANYYTKPILFLHNNICLFVVCFLFLFIIRVVPKEIIFLWSVLTLWCKGRVTEKFAMSREGCAPIRILHYAQESARKMVSLPRVIHWGPLSALFIVCSVSVTGTYTALQLWSLPQVKWAHILSSFFYG